MLSSGLLIWGQTLLALAALGLAGGWALWPFRGPDRPYLWLAAPLAGLAALGGALLALYYGLRLPFAAALPLGWLGLSGVTLTCLLRGGLPRPGVRQGLVALAALGLGSAWGAYVCNRTAIEAGEPTLAVADGSDMFGYAMCADWLRAHPAAQPPRPDHLFEVLPYANLHLEGSRHAAFLLTAAAAQVRGTSSLFSYDWACGVALSAAAVGLGGVFAAGPVGLALLLAAAVTSAWLVVSRTGYLGKTLAYPGCLLLTALYLGALARPSAARVAAACLLGPAVAFCINPILPPLAVGAVLPGLLAALLLRRLSGGAAPGLSDGPPPWRLFVRAVVLYLAVTGPAFAAHRLLFGGGYPAYRLDWGLVVPAALDLESPTLDLVGAGPGRALAAGYFAATLLLLAVALRRGAAAAQGYLLGAALVPFAWLLDKPGVYGFHGLLYPLTMAGAALLLAPAGRRRPARLEGGAVALLAAALVALHVPQAHRAARRYLVGAPPGFAVLTRGDLEALRAGVGDEAVDVSLGDYRDSLPVLSELACRGTAVRLRAPAWELTLANWAAGVGCPPPNAMVPKARFSITEREAFAPPGSVRYRGRRLQLCEDGDAVTFGAVRRAQAVVRDERGRPGYWLGNAPTIIEVHNGTGTAAAVRFRAEGRCGPANPLAGRRTLRYRLGGQEGRQVLGPAGWQADVTLGLAPGRNELVLWVEEPAVPPTAPQGVTLLLWLTDLRLEVGPSPALAE